MYYLPTKDFTNSNYSSFFRDNWNSPMFLPWYLQLSRVFYISLFFKEFLIPVIMSFYSQIRIHIFKQSFLVNPFIIHCFNFLQYYRVLLTVRHYHIWIKHTVAGIPFTFPGRLSQVFPVLLSSLSYKSQISIIQDSFINLFPILTVYYIFEIF